MVFNQGLLTFLNEMRAGLTIGDKRQDYWPPTEVRAIFSDRMFLSLEQGLQQQRRTGRMRSGVGNKWGLQQ
jgi:hypothetical protein